MPIALQGALIGLGVGVLLTLFEYMMLKKAVDERAKRLHRKAQFEDIEKRRITAVMRFALFLPFGFALGAWLMFG